MIDDLIISHLITDAEYGRKVLPFLKDEYFSDNSNKIIFQLTKAYIDKYNSFPTKEALYIDASNLKTLSEQEYKSINHKILNLKAESDTDIQWLLDKTESFCQDRAIYNGIMKSIKILDETKTGLEKGAIPKILQDALSVSFDTNIGHDFLEDWNYRYDLCHKIENKIPFDISFFNEITGGGFSRKTFNVFLAGTGIGKSLVMCHMAAANLMQGHNVLYITLEMAEERIAERIDANLLNVKLDDLIHLPKATYEKLVTNIKSKTTGKLIVKEYPTAAAGTNHFRFLIDELRLKKNFVPDIIYVDYINICCSSRVKLSGNMSSYGYIKSIAEELRGLAVEQNVPIVSATQLNRAGFADSDADMTHTSESWGLPGTVDFMAVIISTEELEGLNQFLIKQLKNRYRDPTKLRKFVIGVDRSKMRLYDTEQSSQNVTDGPVFDETPMGNVTKLDFSKFSDFK